MPLDTCLLMGDPVGIYDLPRLFGKTILSKSHSGNGRFFQV